MEKLVILLLVCIGAFGIANVYGQSKKIVCYVGTWAFYRNGACQFDVEKHITQNFCTHLLYGFFGINNDGTIRLIDPDLDLDQEWRVGYITKFQNLKLKFPGLKTIAAVGGWNEGSKKFSIVAASAELRKRFAVDAREFCLKYKFNGLDMDWEYPADRGGNVQVDKQNFVELLKEIRSEFDKSKLILSAAVGATEFRGEISYNIPLISKYLDFISLMAYDFHGPWNDSDPYGGFVTGLNSPLYVGPTDLTDREKQYNVNSSLHYWLSQGAPREKLILGIPLYGHTFALVDPNQHDIGAASNTAGTAHECLQTGGAIGYNEICKELEQWTRYWSKEQKAPYAVKGNQWASYDDIKSITLKTQYILDHGLGGAMVWSLDTDDFIGVCGNGVYPLMNTIYRILNNGQTIPPSTVPPTTAIPTTTWSTQPTTSTTTPAPPGNEFKCSSDGRFPDPKDCSKFYVCSYNIAYHFTCAQGTLYNAKLENCDYPQNVDCSQVESK
uniref:Putative chitinase like lectin n=1 Tax=Corethrella appendiculata TaxID=1370023 RepID=U5EY78_9DIPT